MAAAFPALLQNISERLFLQSTRMVSVFQCSLTEGACGVHTIATQILGRWQDILHSLNGEGCSVCLHFPWLSSGDLSLFHSLSFHLQVLPCLSDYFCGPCCFLLLLYLLNHKTASLQQSGPCFKLLCWAPGPDYSTLAAFLLLVNIVSVHALFPPSTHNGCSLGQ